MLWIHNYPVENSIIIDNNLLGWDLSSVFLFPSWHFSWHHSARVRIMLVGPQINHVPSKSHMIVPFTVTSQQQDIDKWIMLVILPAAYKDQVIRAKLVLIRSCKKWAVLFFCLVHLQRWPVGAPPLAMGTAWPQLCGTRVHSFQVMWFVQWYVLPWGTDLFDIQQGKATLWLWQQYDSIQEKCWASEWMTEEITHFECYC